MAGRNNCASGVWLQTAAKFGHFTATNSVQPSLCLNLKKHIPNRPEVLTCKSVNIYAAILTVSCNCYVLKSRFFKCVLN